MSFESPDNPKTMIEHKKNTHFHSAKTGVTLEDSNARSLVRPRIMHILPRLSPRGGMERLVFEALMHFDHSLFDHLVCCVRDKTGNANLLEESGVPVYLMSKRSRSDLLYPWRLAKLMKTQQINVVHTYSGIYRDGCLAALLARVPIIIHTDHGRFYPDSNWTRWNHRFFSLFREKVIGVSDGIRDFLVEEVGIPAEKVMTIHDGIDIAAFETQVNRQKRLSELGLSENCLTVGMVGRMVPVKDHETLLKAARLVIESLPETYFLLIGDGPLKADLKSMAAELGISKQVIFLGFRRDVPELMNLFDLVVAPSLHESFSLVLAEAMACEKAVVATQVGGIPEVVENGVTGLLVPPKDPELLAQAILDLLKDTPRRQSMGRAGKVRVKERFSIEAMVKSYESLYESLIKQKGLLT